MSCPECGKTVIRCEEEGTLFANPQLHAKADGELANRETLCPDCGKVKLNQFQPANSKAIQALGFSVGDYV